ncbi:unnamed protein product, partial [Prunus brigantina]
DKCVVCWKLISAFPYVSGMINKDTEQIPGWCNDPHLTPLLFRFMEMMTLVLSGETWRCRAYDSGMVYR